MNVTFALLDQVRDAIPPNGSERDVWTTITKPMWEAFLQEINESPNQVPKQGLSVWGSVTHVIPSKKMYSFSRRLK